MENLKKVLYNSLDIQFAKLKEINKRIKELEDELFEIRIS